ncbi:hypothetical protein NLJ89_g2240 [Agrocybe chaxingu]|uniref:Uncharacterized protein n=1 Tax=Agrocybe chaxingu TaxID=84603 RepID=A0A9W8MYS9_9AGAR|nr:hypothetical protein NLJ89_g2240 [Agrocybe chaxingu]
MASSTSVQATNGYIQQSSGHSNANSIVNSQNTYQYLLLLPDSLFLWQTPLPMPEYTPDNILDYMRTLPLHQLDLIPLWDPSPSEKVREVKIGDVGIFNQKGGFETKFNIFSTDNLAEGFKPPPDFVPCQATEEHIKAIEERWETRCGLIAESTDSKYTCSPMGSIDLMNNLPDWAKGYCSSLYLPYGGRTHSIETAALPDIMQYAATQAPSWYCYKNTAQDGKPLKQIYDELRNKSLVVVTEVWNTSTWYSIQTEEPSDLKSLSRRRIKATVQKSTDPKSHICTHVSDSGLVVHTGPESSVLQGREDQCVALKGFQLIYDPKLPLFSPTSERKGGGDGSSILSRLSFFSRKSRKTKRG